MKRIYLSLLALLLLSGIVSFPAYAGKAQDIVAEIKTSCGKDIEKEAALRLIKKLYVTCAPGSMVDLEDGCRVKCKRERGSGVLGE